MLLSRHQNTRLYRDIEKANRSFENVATFKYLGKTETKEKLIQQEMKRRLNSRLLSKKVKIKHTKL
jgi:uncharacterized protein YqgQ